MANVLLMPSLSPTMESGVISAWRKKAGDKVAVGDVLAEIETDKAAMEWELADEGYLRELLAPTGQELKVGTPIAVLTATPNEDYAAALAEAKSAAAARPAAPAAPVAVAPPQAAPAAVPPQRAQVIPIVPAPPPGQPSASAPAAAGRAAGERARISPYGKKLAEQHELDWRTLAGSGPGGRIVAQDVQAALSAARPAPVRLGQAAAPLAPVPAGAFEDRSLSMMRKAIAKNVTESKQTVPHFQARRKVRMERMLDAREAFKRDFPDLKITVNDLLVKACAVALTLHPAVNSQFLGDRIRRFRSVDIAVAVGTEEGLVAPVIRAAHAKGLREISAEMKMLGEKARDKKLKPEEYQGGTFTLSNLGMFGVTEFNAIIIPPQACILAVSATVKEPVVEGDRLVVGQTMNLTLSSDHRVVDGVTAAQFLATLVKLIENPAALLL